MSVVPRHRNVHLMTSVERDLFELMQEIQTLGTGPLLTEIEEKLTEASDLLGRHVDAMIGQKLLDISELHLKLATEGGTLVCSAECSEYEIAQSRACGRFAVTPDGIGFVWRPAKIANSAG